MFEYECWIHTAVSKQKRLIQNWSHTNKWKSAFVFIKMSGFISFMKLFEFYQNAEMVDVPSIAL